MIFKVKSTTGSLTLNSTQKKIKVGNRFIDFALVSVRRVFSEVGVPVADYEQCEVGIGFVDFFLIFVHHPKLEVGNPFADFEQYKVGKWFADFLIHSAQ